MCSIPQKLCPCQKKLDPPSSPTLLLRIKLQVAVSQGGWKTTSVIKLRVDVNLSQMKVTCSAVNNLFEDKFEETKIIRILSKLFILSKLEKFILNSNSAKRALTSKFSFTYSQDPQRPPVSLVSPRYRYGKGTILLSVVFQDMVAHFQCWNGSNRGSIFRASRTLWSRTRIKTLTPFQSCFWSSQERTMTCSTAARPQMVNIFQQSPRKLISR